MMLPPVMPYVRSRSSGESTWRCSIAPGTFGAYSASTSMQRSANFSLMSSQLPSASLYGAYCTNMLRRCLPGGAIVSIDARGHRHFEDRPLARPAVLGVVVRALQIVERRADVHRAVMMRPDAVARQAREPRRLGEREVDLRRRRRVVDPRDRLAKVLGQLFAASRNFSNVRCASTLEATILRVDLRAVFEPHADRPAAIGENVPHRRLAANLDAQVAGTRRRATSASPPMPPCT